MNNKKIIPAPFAICFWLLIWLLPAITKGAEQTSTDVLFVAYDQGESNAFIQLHKQWDKQGISYQILALGRAKSIFSGNSKLIDTDSLNLPANLSTERNLLIDPDKLSQWAKNISPKIVYSGMASRAQAQILNAFANNSVEKIAFYDNLDPLPNKEYTRPFLEEIQQVDEFHVSSSLTAESFQPTANATKAQVVVTGQPAFTAWDSIFNSNSKAKLRQELALDKEDKVVVFAGDYGGDYPNSFEVFIKSTRLMPNTTFLVTHHPKYSGQLEQEAIDSFAGSNVRLIPKGTFSTAELSTIASAVVVHQSSIAQQALYKGIPVLYVAKSTFSNLLTEHHLAERAYTPESIKQALLRIGNPKNKSLQDTLGIPKTPIDQVTQRIKSILLQEQNQK